MDRPPGAIGLISLLFNSGDHEPIVAAIQPDRHWLVDQLAAPNRIQQGVDPPAVRFHERLVAVLNALEPPQYEAADAPFAPSPSNYEFMRAQRPLHAGAAWLGAGPLLKGARSVGQDRGLFGHLPFEEGKQRCRDVIVWQEVSASAPS